MRFTAVGCILSLGFLLYSCKKPEKLSEEGINPIGSGYYKISYYGKPFAKETMTFSTDVPPENKILWHFSNANTTSGRYVEGRNPKYAFDSAGQYLVSVIINDDTLNKRRQNILVQLKIGHPYIIAEVSKISGTRYWHVYVDSLWPHSYRSDTIAMYNDTFGIYMVDDMTISVKSKLLTATGKAISADSNEVYLFRDTTIHSPLEWEAVLFYHKQDSVVYNSHPYQGGNVTQGKYPSHETYGLTSIYHSFK